METLLDKEYRLSPKDSETNLYIPFELSSDYNRLQIYFIYYPKYLSRQDSIGMAETCLHEYVPETETEILKNLENFLPVGNLVTLSLDYEGSYVGAHHCQEAEQNIIISKQESTRGFLKQEVLKGSWVIQMNMHCIVSDSVTLKIKVTVG